MTENTPRRGTTDYSAWQVRRVISLLAWLQSHPESTLMSAARVFGVSVPQLREEVKQAGSSGLPPYLPGSTLEFSVDTMHATVVNSLGLDRPPALTDVEAGTLVLSLERLGSVLSPEDRASVASATTKIRSLLQENRDRREQFVPDEFTTPAGRQDEEASAPSGADAEHLSVLREAVATRRWVQLDYLSVSSDTTRPRELIPDQLEFINGEGYLWARNSELDQRCFSISRMSGITVTGREAPPVQERRIDATDPFGFAHPDQRWAQIELDEGAGWMFEYLPLWQLDDTDGEESLRALIPDTGAWLERFLLAYAPQIRAAGTSGDADPGGQERDPGHRAADRAAAAVEAYRRLA
ncbi:MAG: WYL domain-containing protein [Mycobacteriaceae bacterium]|uniref:WYL domain-containing protein n=1 Tax=Corynebacterium sp. TaxID=1720 RepID=UPI003F959B43